MQLWDFRGFNFKKRILVNCSRSHFLKFMPLLPAHQREATLGLSLLSTRVRSPNRDRLTEIKHTIRPTHGQYNRFSPQCNSNLTIDTRQNMSEICAHNLLYECSKESERKVQFTVVLRVLTVGRELQLLKKQWQRQHLERIKGLYCCTTRDRGVHGFFIPHTTALFCQWSKTRKEWREREHSVVIIIGVCLSFIEKSVRWEEDRSGGGKGANEAIWKLTFSIWSIVKALKSCNQWLAH